MQCWAPKNKPFNTSTIHYLSRSFNLEPFIMETLFERNIQDESSIAKFLFPSFEQFTNPFLFPDMKRAAVRILETIHKKERMVIFGDYDVDGITSTALLWRGITRLGGDCHFYIPLREEGYGITPQAVHTLVERFQPHVIITVDNGSNAHEAMKTIAQLGLDVIVTDHHEILEGFPHCYAFVNPKRHDFPLPFFEYCGAGVAFKLVHALYHLLHLDWRKYFLDYIELAALGTIADVVPLREENRTLVSLGIKKMKQTPSASLKTMVQALRIPVSDITSTTLSFRMAPIFNAAGRIDDPNLAAHFLIAEREEPLLAQKLLTINQKRKELTNQQYALAEHIIQKENLSKNPFILVAGPFHDGIIGLLAAKICKNYGKPAIVFSSNGKGSARIPENMDFPLIPAIQSGSQFLKKFGGHHAAAGLSIDLHEVSNFSKAVNQFSRPLNITSGPRFFDKTLDIRQFPLVFAEQLMLLEPFGQGNPKPIFFSPSTISDSIECFGKNKEHLKFYFGKKEAVTFNNSKPTSTASPFHFFYNLNFGKQMSFMIVDFFSQSLPLDLVI